MNIKISADSVVDLSDELIKKYDISIAPLFITLGEETKLDGVDITTEQLFEYVDKTGDLPKTASPSAELYSDFFKKNLENAEYIIHFVISSKISSCYENAKKAAGRFDGRVFVIDSRSLSSGIALLALYASERAQEGVPAEQIAQECNALTHNVQASFVLGDLNYMHKGGRCSGAMRLSAKFLQIKPEIRLVDGEMKVGKKYMGKLAKVVDTYVDYTLQMYPNYDRKRVFITHTPIDESIVKAIEAKLKDKFDEVLETKAGATISSHCGLGTIGILFLTK